MIGTRVIVAGASQARQAHRTPQRRKQRAGAHQPGVRYAGGRSRRSMIVFGVRASSPARCACRTPAKVEILKKRKSVTCRVSDRKHALGPGQRLRVNVTTTSGP
jgi:hypothetical protein